MNPDELMQAVLLTENPDELTELAELITTPSTEDDDKQQPSKDAKAQVGDWFAKVASRTVEKLTESENPRVTNQSLEDMIPLPSPKIWKDQISSGQFPEWDEENERWALGDESISWEELGEESPLVEEERRDALGRRMCFDDNTGKRIPCDPVPREEVNRRRREKREEELQRQLAQKPKSSKGLSFLFNDSTEETKALGEVLTPERTAELMGVSEEELHKLVGAQDGSEVSFRFKYKTPVNGESRVQVEVYLEHPFVSDCSRTLKFEDGQWVCSNNMFFLKRNRKGGGFGMRQFSEQVANLQAAGFGEIETCAGRGDGMIGYYVWPRFGYDMELDEEFIEKLPKEFKGAKTVQDLMATPEGREYWKKKGYMDTMHFDLAPGSRSMQVMNAYLESKGKPMIDATTQEDYDNAKKRRNASHSETLGATHQVLGEKKKAELEARQKILHSELAKKGNTDVMRAAEDIGLNPYDAERAYNANLKKSLERNPSSEAAEHVQWSARATLFEMEEARHHEDLKTEEASAIRERYREQLEAIGSSVEELQDKAMWEMASRADRTERLEFSYDRSFKRIMAERKPKEPEPKPEQGQRSGPLDGAYAALSDLQNSIRRLYQTSNS